MKVELRLYLLPRFTVSIFRGAIWCSERTLLINLAPRNVSNDTTMASSSGIRIEGP